MQRRGPAVSAIATTHIAYTPGPASASPWGAPPSLCRQVLLPLPAGDDFSIADISSMPYMRLVMTAAGGGDLVAKYPNVQVLVYDYAACRIPQTAHAGC
jgi:hypothetical protein